MTTTEPVPGVGVRHVFPVSRPVFRTGVPAFLGAADTVARLDYGQEIALAAGPLCHAVHSFFANGGASCYLVPLPAGATALPAALATVDSIDDADLICAPGLTKVEAQQAILRHCQERGDLFAILDTVASPVPVDAVRHRDQLAAGLGAARSYGALYYPWLRTGGVDMPPCGAVAGVYARSDRRSGVHKAPANEPLDDVVDVLVTLPAEAVGELYASGVNCVLALPGRDIRVWGARTLSADEAWRDITTRRLLITLTRWIDRFLTSITFAPNGPALRLRISRELGAYLDELFNQGALKGATPEEAYFIRFADEHAPDRVVTHVGVALTRPAEFIDVRIMHAGLGV